MGPSNKQNNGAISSSSTTPYQQLHSNNTIKASGDQSKVSATRPSTIATVTNTSARPSASPSGREALLRDEEGDNADYRLYMTERALTSFDTDESLSEEDKMVIQRLACRKFHMPGRTFWGDYCYW